MPMKHEDIVNYLDDNQKRLCDIYPDNPLLDTPEHIARTIDWITFYRRNEEIFVTHYLGLQSHLFQEMWLHHMGVNDNTIIVSARTTSKTYSVAIHACVQCILYPGSLVVVAAATKEQARILVYEKIRGELMRDSPNLRAEIESITQGKNDTKVSFYNDSSIFVVVANENARGHRAHLLILDEFRTMKEKNVTSILEPFLLNYNPPYTYLPEYADIYNEPRTVYISSNWLASHWMHQRMQSACRLFIEHQGTVFFAADYSLSLKHGIKSWRTLRQAYDNSDDFTWNIEYRNLAPRESSTSYFTVDLVVQCRTLLQPFYPRKNEDVVAKVKNKYSIPRQNGEIRIVSCDIAMVNKKGNDNSCFACIRLLPDSQDGDAHSGYKRQVVYLEAMPGEDTLKQALRIKQLFDDFHADYCVLDLRNAGISVYDMLARIQFDPDRNKEYPAWTCINDDVVAARVPIMGALKVVYGVMANAKLNSEIAESLRNHMQKKNIQFLEDFETASDVLRNLIPEYFETTDVDLQVYYEKPFHETSAMVGEIVSLEYEQSPTTGVITVHEVGNATKDRYTAVSYGNYFADLLERDLFSNWDQYKYQILVN